MIVVDTNVVSYLLFPTPFSDLVDKLYTIDSNWVAPLLWKSEFRNVLALYLRKGVITFNKALQLQDMAESIFAHNEFEVSSAQVLNLVNNSHCSAYDCEFVALASYLNTTFITQDQKILTEFSSTAISIADFLASI